MSCLKIYLRRIFWSTDEVCGSAGVQQGRTSAKGRIEYESGNQKDTGNGKTGTVCRDYCRAGDDTAGLSALGVLRPTTIHIPVILGSILLGWKKGAALGGLFGLTSLLVNTFTPNPTSFVFSPFYSLGEIGGNGWSLVICFVPRILVGVAPYFVYKGMKKLIKVMQPV